jgi:short-subunit dehydrogenase
VIRRLDSPANVVAPRGRSRDLPVCGSAEVPRLAVITGGSSGIGAAVARRLARAGWRSILVARGAERLRAVADEIGAEYEVCDVGDRSSVDRMAASVRERHPALELLVSNAGIPGRSTFLELEPERIEELLRVNYLASVWCVRAFLPALEAGRPSHVVNVVSVAGTVASGRSGPYSASKHAQLAFSRALGVELEPRGIRVHTVNPGFVDTEGFPQRALLGHPLLRRVVTRPSVVAEAVVRSVERDRSEVFVPGWYRTAAIVQALVPGTLSRLLPRRGR